MEFLCEHSRWILVVTAFVAVLVFNHFRRNFSRR